MSSTVVDLADPLRAVARALGVAQALQDDLTQLRDLVMATVAAEPETDGFQDLLRANRVGETSIALRDAYRHGALVVEALSIALYALGTVLPVDDQVAIELIGVRTALTRALGAVRGEGAA